MSQFSKNFDATTGWSDIALFARQLLSDRLAQWLADYSQVEAIDVQFLDIIANQMRTVCTSGEWPVGKKASLTLTKKTHASKVLFYGELSVKEANTLWKEISSLMRALQSLQKQKIASDIFDHSSIIMYQAKEMAGRWVLTRVNKTLTEFLGVPESDLLGADAKFTLTDFIHPDEVARLIASYDLVRTTAREMTLHYRMKNAQGDYIPVTERVEYSAIYDQNEANAIVWHREFDQADSQTQYQIFQEIEQITQDIALETGRDFLLHFTRRLEAFDDVNAIALIARSKHQWWETREVFHNSRQMPAMHFQVSDDSFLTTLLWDSKAIPGNDEFVDELLFGSPDYHSIVPLRYDSENIEAALLFGSKRKLKDIEGISQMVRIFGLRILREIEQIRIADAQLAQNVTLESQKQQLKKMVSMLGQLDTVPDEQSFVRTIDQNLKDAFDLQCVDWLYWASGEWHLAEKVSDAHQPSWYEQSRLVTKEHWLTYLESCRRSGVTVHYRGRQRVFWPIGSSEVGFMVVVLTFYSQLPEAELLEFTQNALSLALQGLMQRENLRFQAMRDSLTGLGNRIQLHAWVKVALPTQSEASLLLFDLNRFKEINDSFGHQFGDKLLQEIGPRISYALAGKRHYLSRLGGDEFALFLPDTSTEESLLLAQTIHTKLAESYIIDGLRFQVEASVGVANFPEHGKDGHELLRCADVAMYSAKNSNQSVRVFDTTLDNSTPLRIAVLSELDDALKEGQLWVAYQPLMSTETGQTAGFEALVRWTHPVFGPLSPAEFIPIAEMGEGIRKITEFVLRDAMARVKGWQTFLPSLHVAVNISPRVLLDHQFPINVAELLREFELDGQAIIFELTESTLLVDPIRAVEIIHSLSELGIQAEIDDFGTGYSSLSYLKSLPISALKIDQSFVTDILDDTNNQVIVQSTIHMAHSLGLKTVAEGVEDEATLLKMMRLGCDMIQGYYFAKPIPATDVTDWLKRNL